MCVFLLVLKQEINAFAIKNQQQGIKIGFVVPLIVTSVF